MHIPLPDSWVACPRWWKDLVNEIEAKGVTVGITIYSGKWSDFLEKKLKEQGADFRLSKGLDFSSEEDYLVFRLKNGV
jgi:hypothetical protein